jgi:Tol biopolymer transport system component
MRFTTLLASLSVTLLLVASGCVSQTSRQAHPIRFSIFPQEKVTFGDLDSAGPGIISPDGSLLAYVGVDDNGSSQIWVRPLEALDSHSVAGTANARYPFWSPDSEYLAFFADGKLKKISLSGGPPQKLCDAPEGRGGSWGKSPDGGPGIIVFAPLSTGGLSRVSATGGEPVRVTVPDLSRQEVSHRQPDFLPDGHHFLYVAVSNRTENTVIFAGDIQAKPGEKSIRLMSGVAHVSYASTGYLLFLRDDNLVTQAFDARRLVLAGQPKVLANRVAHGYNSQTSDFSVSANGVLAWRSLSGAARQLAWFDRNGKQVRGLDARGPYFNPSLSPDRKRIAVSRLDSLLPPTGNIWLFDLVRGPWSRLTSGSGAQLLPVWAPDGRRIVFGRAQPPDFGLYIEESHGAGKETLLLKTAQLSVPMDWSRDGQFILFAQLDATTKWDLWVVPVGGDRKPVPVVRTEFNEGDGQISPDGNWIAYWSDESGRWEIYVRSFPRGGARVTASKWQVSTQGGTWPRWRGDGRELFFKAQDGKIMAVPVKEGSTFEAGVPAVLFDTHELEPDNLTYDVRPDGQQFLVSRMFEGGAVRPMNVCLNCLADTKR